MRKPKRGPRLVGLGKSNLLWVRCLDYRPQNVAARWRAIRRVRANPHREGLG